MGGAGSRIGRSARRPLWLSSTPRSYFARGRWVCAARAHGRHEFECLTLIARTSQEYRNLLPADISDAPLSVESGSGDDANGNGTQALYIDARALQIVFQGAAVNGGLMFFATLAFMLTR